MSANDGHATRLWVLVVKWSVLLDGNLELVVFMICSCSWVFAYMRCGERVFLDLEQRHLSMCPMRMGLYHSKVEVYDSVLYDIQ
jgi:hypothetical protein